MPVRNIRQRPGFTLVELLVVITIIGILVALVTVAGWRAVISTRQWAISVEVNNLEQGITAYKEKAGDFPPDTITLNSTPSDVIKQNIVLAHLRRVYPRNREGNPFLANRGDGQPGAFYTALNPGRELDPSEAYVYFLGGGLYDNPEYPLSGPGQRKNFHEFKAAQLVDLDGDGFASYIPPYGSMRAPYVYLDSRTYAISLFDLTASSQGVARPYRSDTTGPPTPTTWESATTFQIISAGLDGHYGDNPTPATNFKQYPSGVYYTRQDRDNVTSFAEGALEAKLP